MISPFCSCFQFYRYIFSERRGENLCLKLKFKEKNYFLKTFHLKQKKSEYLLLILASLFMMNQEPIKNLENWQMNVKVEDGVCVDQKAADMMLGYFNGITEMTFTQTPTGSYICRTKSTTQIDQLN